MSPSPIAAILFDLDDTLLDRRRSVERYLTGHATRAMLDATVIPTYHARFWELDDNGHRLRAELFDQLAGEFPTIGSSAELLADFLQHGFATCEWTTGAEDALAWCRNNGLRSGIITNGPSSMQRAKLKALGLAELVDVILVSGEEGVSKPSTEIFHRAAERLGVSPEDCVFIGDNPIADIDGARRAGMLDIWMRGHFPWPSELAPPSHSIESLSAIRDLATSVLALRGQHG